MEEEIEAGKPIENAEINLEKKGWGICGKRKRIGASLATSPNIIRISKMRRCCQ